MHHTEQTDQSRPTIFRKYWASFNNGVNVTLQKYGKGGGRGVRTSRRQVEFYFDDSLFVCCFFLSLLVCSFSFSSQLKGTPSI